MTAARFFTNFITTQEAKPGGETECGTTYVGELKPSHILGTWLRYQQKEYNNETFITYGFGDGGGGPTREMLETQRRLKYGLPGFPKTKPAGAYETLEKIKNNFIKSSALFEARTKNGWVSCILSFIAEHIPPLQRIKRNNRECEILFANRRVRGTNGGSVAWDGVSRKEALFRLANGVA